MWLKLHKQRREDLYKYYHQWESAMGVEGDNTQQWRDGMTTELVKEEISPQDKIIKSETTTINEKSIV